MSPLKADLQRFYRALGFLKKDLFEVKSSDFDGSMPRVMTRSEGTVDNFVSEAPQRLLHYNAFLGIARRLDALVAQRAYEFKKHYGDYDELNLRLRSVSFIRQGNPPDVDWERLVEMFQGKLADDFPTKIVKTD